MGLTKSFKADLEIKTKLKDGDLPASSRAAAHNHHSAIPCLWDSELGSQKAPAERKEGDHDLLPTQPHPLLTTAKVWSQPRCPMTRRAKTLVSFLYRSSPRKDSHSDSWFEAMARRGGENIARGLGQPITLDLQSGGRELNTAAHLAFSL